MNKKGKYLLLGGNQTDTIKLSEYGEGLDTGLYFNLIKVNGELKIIKYENGRIKHKLKVN